MKPKSSIDPNKLAVLPAGVTPEQYSSLDARNIKVKQAILKQSIAIRARIEWLAVQAVTTGKNIIKGEGIERYELDWNIKSRNMITQAGGAAWSGIEWINNIPRSSETCQVPVPVKPDASLCLKAERIRRQAQDGKNKLIG